MGVDVPSVIVGGDLSGLSSLCGVFKFALLPVVIDGEVVDGSDGVEASAG